MANDDLSENGFSAVISVYKIDGKFYGDAIIISNQLADATTEQINTIARSRLTERQGKAMEKLGHTEPLESAFIEIPSSLVGELRPAVDKMLMALNG